MKHTKGGLVFVLTLGILFCNVYQVHSDLLKKASQLVFLTGSGNGGNTPLSSLKRINADGSLTNFVVPTGMVFILNSVSISFSATNSLYSNNHTSAVYVDFSIGNFFSAKGIATVYSSSGSYGYYKGTAMGGCGMPISSQYWNSNSLLSTLSEGMCSSCISFGSLKITMSGYLAPW
jgi:hypothetical protein